MFWRAWRLHKLGVLGINRRNGDYVMRYNERRYYPLADDKLRTKSIAIAAGMAVPDLYGVIETQRDIRRLPQIVENREAFVIKPACGSGGNGILVLSRRGDTFRRPDGRVIGYGWMWAGLIAAYSRAPWLMTVLLLFCYLLMSPGGTTRFMKALCIGALVSVAVLVSPVGDKVIDNMPFIGTMESENVYYRQQLAEATWRLLKQNPLFGDPFVYLQMDDMKNGQGLIDLVNAYAGIALFHGAVGLVAYIGFQSVAFFRALAAARRVRETDPDLALLGACLLACTLATIFFEITSGFMWMAHTARSRRASLERRTICVPSLKPIQSPSIRTSGSTRRSKPAARSFVVRPI